MAAAYDLPAGALAVVRYVIVFSLAITGMLAGGVVGDVLNLPVLGGVGGLVAGAAWGTKLAWRTYLERPEPPPTTHEPPTRPSR